MPRLAPAFEGRTEKYYSCGCHWQKACLSITVQIMWLFIKYRIHWNPSLADNSTAPCQEELYGSFCSVSFHSVSGDLRLLRPQRSNRRCIFTEVLFHRARRVHWSFILYLLIICRVRHYKHHWGPLVQSKWTEHAAVNRPECCRKQQKLSWQMLATAHDKYIKNHQLGLMTNRLEIQLHSVDKKQVGKVAEEMFWATETNMEARKHCRLKQFQFQCLETFS